MSIIQDKVTPEFKKWVGYCEKQKQSQIGTYDNPEDYKKNSGSNNYTVFADLYKKETGINVQGCAWCDCFVDTVLIHLFGKHYAERLLGGFSAYTPTSVNYYKKIGHWIDGRRSPREGDQIFLYSSKLGRVCHTEYVYAVDDQYVYTIGGNTSSDSVPENEGGCVAYKKYPIGMSGEVWRIEGYGRPDYTIVEEVDEGWRKAADGKRWWYEYSDRTYAVGWKLINHHWFFFDEEGYMLTGWQQINNKWYFLEQTENHALEGACYHETDEHDGSLEIWYVK